MNKIVELFCAGEIDHDDVNALVSIYRASIPALEVGLGERISRLEERLGGVTRARA